jgi:hypothetical protein
MPGVWYYVALSFLHSSVLFSSLVSHLSKGRAGRAGRARKIVVRLTGVFSKGLRVEISERSVGDLVVGDLISSHHKVMARHRQVRRK